MTAIKNAADVGPGFSQRSTWRHAARPGLAPPHPPGDDRRPVEFEAEALRAAGLAHELIPPRYRTAYFQHIFASGYSAGYYAYIWSEVLDAETVEWFTENGGMTRTNGDVFRRRLLGVGGSVDALGAFRSVRGRDATIEPLLRRRGLAPVDAA